MKVENKMKNVNQPKKITIPLTKSLKFLHFQTDGKIIFKIIDVMNLQKKKSEFYIRYQLRNKRFYIFTILPYVA